MVVHIAAGAAAAATVTAKAVGLVALRIAGIAAGMNLLSRFTAPPQPFAPSPYGTQLAAHLQDSERERLFRLQLQHEDLSRKIEERQWPIGLSPSAYRNLSGQTLPQPMVVIFIPPNIEDTGLATEVTDQLESRIRHILSRRYSPNDPQRPVQFLGSGWRKGTSRGETALHNIHHLAPHVPTTLIQLDRIHNEVHLLIGQFSCGPAGSIIPPLVMQSASAPVGAHLTQLAREESDRLQGVLGNDVDLALLGGGHILNLALLKSEQQSGQSLGHYFQPTKDQFLEAIEIIAPALQLVVAGLADLFHLVRHGTLPLLPRLMSEIISDVPVEAAKALTQQILSEYRQAYVAIASQLGPRGPDLLIDLAMGFAAAEGNFVPVAEEITEAASLLEQAISRFLVFCNAPADVPIAEFARTSGRQKDLPFLTRVADMLMRLARDSEAATLRAACAEIKARAHEEPREVVPDPFIEAMKAMVRPEQAGA